MIAIKPGVRLHGIRPEIVLALLIINGLYTSVSETVFVTSVIDGSHMRTSLHYVGAAIDVRLPLDNPEEMRDRIRNALGFDYDVVLEKGHIHVEWQPKEPYS